MPRWNARDGAALAAIVAVAGLYSLGVIDRQARTGLTLPSYDIYGQFLPNMLYALDRLREGGAGFLWNRLQNCGQPFFANAALGLLYPLHALLLWTDPYTALLLLFALHLAIGGAGTFALCRQLGAGPLAALCGSLAFQLGTVTTFLGVWLPTILAGYCWLPVALAAGERLSRRPAAGGAVLLGAVLTVQFLAGHPQVTLFTYQLLLLRLVWDLIAGSSAGRRQRGIAFAASLLLPAALGAVQLLPALEFAGQSLRGRSLTAGEIQPAAESVGWAKFRLLAAMRLGYGGIFPALSLGLAGYALVSRATRRHALFYLLVAALYFALAFDNPLSALYRDLPFGSFFRMPVRFLWVAAFAAAVLTALGAAALARQDPLRQRRGWSLGLPLAAGIALYLLSRTLPAREGALLAAVGALSVAAPRSARIARAASFALLILLVANLFPSVARPFFGYLSDESMLFRNREVFRFVGARMTPQDRMYPFGPQYDFSLQRKSASLFGLASIDDYETQTSARYAELFVRLVRDRPMTSINDFYYLPSPVPKNLPLLNLVAGRYVIVESAGASFAWQPPPTFREIWRRDDLRVYENTAALPRAFYVPRAEAVADRALLLERLADPAHDPLAVALVESAPPGAQSAGGTGTAHIVSDEPEELLLEVDATRAGFLFLSDQDYPGWQAWVNGVPAPILRANHAFRLIAVPGGRSTVLFRYRPFTVRLGLVCSLVSLALLLAFLVLRSTSKLRRPRAVHHAEPE